MGRASVRAVLIAVACVLLLGEASGGAQAPRISCFGRQPTIIGTPGDDVILGTPGADVIMGGEGNDDIVGEDILNRSGGNDRICGGGGDDFLDGSLNNDMVAGGPGNDGVSGGQGSDLLEGQSGQDSLQGEGFFSRPSAGPANDRLMGGAGDDALAGGPGNDVLDGGGGVQDQASYFNADGITANLGRGAVRGEGADRLVQVEGVAGSRGDDTLIGSSRSDLLIGGDGDDRLSGGAGADFVSGGDGSDRVDSGRGRDYCLDERGAGCEISGVPEAPGALAAMRRLAQQGNVTGEYVQRPECLTSGGATRAAAVARRRPQRHPITVSPPRRVLTTAGRAARRPASAAVDQVFTWQATLFRYDARARRWLRAGSTITLRAVVPERVSVVDRWTNAAGRPVARLTLAVTGAGRYAWRATIGTEQGTGQDWVEPHVNVANRARGLFQPWCAFAR